MRAAGSELSTNALVQAGSEGRATHIKSGEYNFEEQDQRSVGLDRLSVPCRKQVGEERGCPPNEGRTKSLNGGVETLEKVTNGLDDCSGLDVQERDFKNVRHINEHRAHERQGRQLVVARPGFNGLQDARLSAKSGVWRSKTDPLTC